MLFDFLNDWKIQGMWMKCCSVIARAEVLAEALNSALAPAAARVSSDANLLPFLQSTNKAREFLEEGQQWASRYIAL